MSSSASVVSRDAAEDAAPIPGTPLEWEAVADEAMAAIAARVEPFARKAADEFYARVLETAQDYLCDNARFNIAERIHSSERAAQLARQEANALRADLGELATAINLILPLAKGYRPEDQTASARVTCQSWITAAEAAIAKVEAPK